MLKTQIRSNNGNTDSKAGQCRISSSVTLSSLGRAHKLFHSALSGGSTVVKKLLWRSEVKSVVPPAAGGRGESYFFSESGCKILKTSLLQQGDLFSVSQSHPANRNLGRVPQRQGQFLLNTLESFRNACRWGQVKKVCGWVVCVHVCPFFCPCNCVPPACPTTEISQVNSVHGTGQWNSRVRDVY